MKNERKNDMSLILCIETGTDICSVGLARDGELISLRESDQGRDHARQVGVFVDELLSQTGIAPEELDAVAVGKGPGSYTGLRIGVSFAKGLCYGLRIPLVAIGSLDALTEVAKEDYEAGILSVDRWEEACLCPMVDARRMEVYTRVFDAAGTPLSDVSAEVVTAESFAAWRGDGRPFVIFGNGAAKCAGLLPDATLIQVAPSARGLARLAQEALDAGRTEDIAYFEPFYLKDFVVTPVEKEVILNYRRECVPGLRRITIGSYIFMAYITLLWSLIVIFALCYSDLAQGEDLLSGADWCFGLMPVVLWAAIIFAFLRIRTFTFDEAGFTVSYPLHFCPKADRGRRDRLYRGFL